MLTQFLLVILEHDVGESLKVSKLKLSWFDSRLRVLGLLIFIAVRLLQCHILFLPKYR